MEKSTAYKIDLVLGLLIFISFFTTDWDYLNSDEGGDIMVIVYLAYTLIIGIALVVTYLGYTNDSGEGKPPSKNADEIKILRRNSTIIIAIGIIAGAYQAAFMEPGEGLGLLMIAVIFTVSGIVMGLYAKMQENRLIAHNA